jgi:cyclic pyranopterin phosphate synthase
MHETKGLVDLVGRKINYLRLSVTDSCNLSCRYCDTGGGAYTSYCGNPLSYDDLFLLAQAAVSLGIEKIRITGGEPLLRRDIIPFLSRLSRIAGLEALVLTTNGILLDTMADEILKAGVKRVNISLDSLRPSTFAHITRGGDLKRILRGISAAEKAGFPSIKINMVVMRGINDSEIYDFASLTIGKPYEVRFIEYMPTAGDKNWQKLSISGEEVTGRIKNMFPLTPLEKEYLAGPARNFRIEGAAGKIGIISPLSCHFCEECNRIRATSWGTIRSCLFSEIGMDIRPILKARDEAWLKRALRQIVATKPDRHFLPEKMTPHIPSGMLHIGG